ncbi:MAG TPA: metabolite traffic protein EboE, partial [Phycisphaerales bacterium]|nr:metabolite traffic protein EboE [Phycisphaerales bacterium]
ARLAYTLDLVNILAALLPDGEEGSISTLPIGWPPESARQSETESLLASSAAQLVQVADACAQLEAETGRVIHLDLEPEPGCILQRSEDVIGFFEKHVASHEQDRDLRRYLRVCHDICHAAVMFEDQAELFDRYDHAGIRVGKVQVSSAVRVRFEAMDESQRHTAFDQLRAFSEQRYLHQTVIRPPDERATPLFYEDLSAALDAEPPRGEWRVHFHVPIFLGEFGHLESTRDQIVRCLWLLRDRAEVRHFEVETYAWDVLPESMRSGPLAEGIAREMQWLRDRFAQPPASGNGAHGDES